MRSVHEIFYLWAKILNEAADRPTAAVPIRVYQIAALLTIAEVLYNQIRGSND